MRWFDLASRREWTRPTNIGTMAVARVGRRKSSVVGVPSRKGWGKLTRVKPVRAHRRRSECVPGDAPGFPRIDHVVRSRTYG